MRATFVNCLTERAKKDARIFLITPDMGFSVFEDFKERFPERFLNTGVAEQNAINIAAGLSLSGRIVYVYSIIPFVTMRCFEQVRLSLAYLNTNVRIVGIGAGMTYGSAGATHHAVEDIAIMRALPNMTICCPGDPVEARELINQSFDFKGPMYIRLGKNNESIIHGSNVKIHLGKAVKIQDGKDLALISTSNMLAQGKEWIEEWKREGIKAAFYSMHTIKPLDIDLINNLIRKKIPIITLEEHNIIGGLGSAVAEVISESGTAVKFKRIGIPDQYSHYIGSHNYLKNKMGLTQKPSLDFLHSALK